MMNNCEFINMMFKFIILYWGMDEVGFGGWVEVASGREFWS